MSRTIFASLMAFAAAGSLMAASAATSVTATTGETGSVIVVRGGETFSLQSGDPLFDGDRIVTRSDASVDITSDACVRTIPASSTIVIGADFCETIIASAEETILADAGEITTGGGTGAALPILGGLVAAGGAAAAAGGGSDSPPRATSP